MNQDLNNQNTLFRLVSLRSPELTKKENQDRRFVLNPDPVGGVFYPAAQNGTKNLKGDTIVLPLNEKEKNSTKWDTMVSAAETFPAFQNEKEIADLYPQHLELADWITRNRAILNSTDLVEKLDGLGELKPSDEVELWDNLYYQVLTQKDFYVKEAVMQLLVLQNILRNKDVFTELRDEEETKQLLSARVVLPAELFDELALMQNATIADEEGEYDGIVPKELVDAQQIEEARIATANIEGILSELNEIEANHREEGEIAYKKELAEFQKENHGKIKELISNYQKTYNEQLREIDNQLDAKYGSSQHDLRDRPYNQPDVEYPELPEFVFEYPQEPDMSTVQTKLSADSLAILSTQVGELKNIASCTKLKQVLTSQLENVEQQAVKKIKTSEQIVVFGDTAIQAGNFVPAQDLFKFQICSSKLINGNVGMCMNILLPNGYDVQKIAYTLDNGSKNGGGITDSYFNSSSNGNVVTLSNLFNNTLPASTQATGMSGKITFTNGQVQAFATSINSATPAGGRLENFGTKKLDTEKDFQPNTFGYRRLGIADYQKVVSKVCRYEAGEVAHIENVMARELREKSTKRFHQRQIVETNSQEIETEKITDTSSAERFEMQNEISKLLQEDRQVSAYANVSAKWGAATINAGASYASSVSKQESNRQAISQAKEITQRASERILARVKNEKTVSTTEEFTETNKHLFDNTKSGEHVSGVYRFINAIYKNRIFNYGKRLMYEFMVPQPGKLHQIAMTVSSNSDSNTVTLEEPIDPRDKYSDFTKITKNNYQELAAKYGASVNEYPKETLSVSKSFAGVEAGANEMHEGTADIQLPEGYITVDASLKFSAKWDQDNSGQRHAVNIAFGDIGLYAHTENLIRKDLTEFNLIGRNWNDKYSLVGYKDSISFSYSLLNYMSFGIAFSINLKLDDTKIEQWKRETFERIMEGYERQLATYNQSLAEKKEIGVQILDSNPMFYRQIEQTVLRKNCISYLLDHKNPNSVKKFGLEMYSGTTLTEHQVNLTKKMDDYSSFVKFMEQAFDWELMSYSFYPYYWANKNEWANLYKFDSDDATFRSFMQAGMARVVVTVRPGFEDAVALYMTKGQIWDGGAMPVIGDSLYLSIVDELKEQEYEIEDSWETMLPTNLIALQRGGVAIDAEGLPVLDADAIKGSNAELGNGNEKNN
ncbi:MAG: hypothetical protein LBH22_09155 [Bacteroidales bacterium]|jgi:hypothetical protein|nr:hypothetical protein [Bacteroidales bacterium]